jgi:hypothetical protein
VKAHGPFELYPKRRLSGVAMSKIVYLMMEYGVLTLCTDFSLVEGVRKYSVFFTFLIELSSQQRSSKYYNLSHF